MADIFEEAALRFKGAMRETGGKFVDQLIDATRAVVEGVEKAGDIVSHGVSGSAGYIKDGVYYVQGKAVEGAVQIKDGVVKVGEEVVGNLVNTTRFFSDAQYRNEEGIPWLNDVIASNRKLLAHQMNENTKAMGVLYRYSLGEDLGGDELEVATEQLLDMARLVPALAIFLLPGGMMLLPMFAKLLPWDLIPDLRPPEAIEE